MVVPGSIPRIIRSGVVVAKFEVFLCTECEAKAKIELNWKKIYRVLKWVIGIGFLIATYFKFKNKGISSEGFHLFNDFVLKDWFLFLSAISLAWLNWNIERKKWQILLKSIFPISTYNAWKSVLAGLAVSSLMPNRTAEYGGRILFLPKSKRMEAVPKSMEGGTAQLSITLFLGSIIFIGEGIKNDWTKVVIGLILLIFSFLLIGALKRISKILSNLFVKYNWSKVFQQYAQEKSESYRLIWLLSLLRYFVFSSQYVLFLSAFGVNGSMVELYGYVMILFLYQSFIPVPAMFDLGVRAVIGSFLFSDFELEFGMAALSIWVVNLVIPSIIGLVFFYASKFTNDELVAD